MLLKKEEGFEEKFFHNIYFSKSKVQSIYIYVCVCVCVCVFTLFFTLYHSNNLMFSYVSDPDGKERVKTRTEVKFQR